MCMSEWNGDIKKTNQQTYSRSQSGEKKRDQTCKNLREK